MSKKKLGLSFLSVEKNWVWIFPMKFDYYFNVTLAIIASNFLIFFKHYSLALCKKISCNFGKKKFELIFLISSSV